MKTIPYLVLTTMITLSFVFVSCGNKNPEVTRQDLDRAVATMETKIDTAVVDIQKSLIEPAADEPKPVMAEEVFPDMFQNATRVDKVSIDDIKNCEVVSSFEVKLGDTVSVEVALARKEDGLSGRFTFRPYFTLIRDTSGDGILGNIAEDYHLRFGLERTINNP